MALEGVKVFLHIADQEPRHVAKKAIKKLGATMTKDAAAATVVVVENESDPGTAALLESATELRKPVVGSSWLARCREHKKHLDVQPFLLVPYTPSRPDRPAAADAPKASVASSAAEKAPEVTTAAPSDVPYLLDEDDLPPPPKPALPPVAAAAAAGPSIFDDEDDAPAAAKKTTPPPKPSKVTAKEKVKREREPKTDAVKDESSTAAPKAKKETRKEKTCAASDESPRDAPARKKTRREEGEGSPRPSPKPAPKRQRRKAAEPDPERFSAIAQTKRRFATARIAFSDVSDREVLSEIAASLGAIVAEDIFGRCKKPTHLVVGGKELTPKILLALALGIPILRPDWLFMSLDAGSLLPIATADGQVAEHDFFHEQFDKHAYLERQQKIPRRDPRMLPIGPTRGPAVLDGTVLYFAGQSTSPGNDVLKELATSLGASVVRLISSDLTAIIQCGDMPRAERAEAKIFPCVAPQWLIDCVARCARLPMDGPYLIAAATPAPEGSPSRAPKPPPQTTPDAREVALNKRSPGPASAIKQAKHQWSTQQLRESDNEGSSDESDSDSDSDSSESESDTSSSSSGSD